MVAKLSETAGTSGSVTGATVTIPATTAGSFLAIVVNRSGGLSTGALTGVTDSAGQTWSMVTRGSVSGVGNTRVELWVFPNSAAGVTSVTWSSGVAQLSGWNVQEWSGIKLTTPLLTASPDNSGVAIASTAIATPTISPAVTALIIAAMHSARVNATLDGAVFTALTNADYSTTGTGKHAAVFNAAAGSYSASWTLDVAQSAGTLIAAFEAASGVTPNGLAIPVSLGNPSPIITPVPTGLAIPVTLGTPTIGATIATSGALGGWWGLLSIEKENREYVREERYNPPQACPNDGEPLQRDPKGRLRCPYDGWVWKGHAS